MYVHEHEYKARNRDEYQDRYLKIDSWTDYCRCVLGYSRSKPSIDTPDNFKVIKITEHNELTGHFYITLKTSTIEERQEVMLIARVVGEKDIPQDADIWEIEVFDDDIWEESDG